MGKVVKLPRREAPPPVTYAELVALVECLVEMAEVDAPFLYEAVGKGQPEGWHDHLAVLAVAKAVVARAQGA